MEEKRIKVRQHFRRPATNLGAPEPADCPDTGGPENDQVQRLMRGGPMTEYSGLTTEETVEVYAKTPSEGGEDTVFKPGDPNASSGTGG